ncbi:sigma 54-interacting transcriptional regulator [uncultured Duncaniella sp.]|uniref:sigma-54-dependent transcriptional regulator n=3 Tax=uncultured Duncaniella sp. TaxID=2768039 RepID=UPI002605CD5F|nr:sigma 54-interacting transcriptional regulator [uncultured Duncaniella sp.]
MNKVLIVDASASDGRIMAGLLIRAGYDPVVTDCIEAGKVEAAKLPPGAVIVTAMRLPAGTARELIDWLKAEGYKFPVIAIVENLNGMDVAEVMRGGGAVDIIQRPAIDKQLVETVGEYSKAEHIVLTLDNQLLPRKSEEWQMIEEKIKAIAATNANAIIFGECGSGKEQVAHQIYLNSSREQKPITIVDAGGAALVGRHNPENERSEIYNRIEGYFHKSAGGTIIIKNVHLLTFEKQSVLLHILETEHPDVRVICTAEPELLKMVTEKTFRPNLFFILRQSDIAVPPLKETAEDIPVIADFFLKRYAAQTGKPRKHLDASAIKALKLYPWPGNVRELKDIVLFAAFHAKGDTISEADIVFNLSDTTIAYDLSLRNPQRERDQILEAYQRGGNWKQAAKLLNITEKTLISLRKKYGIDSNGEIQS